MQAVCSMQQHNNAQLSHIFLTLIQLLALFFFFFISFRDRAMPSNSEAELSRSNQCVDVWDHAYAICWRQQLPSHVDKCL